MIARFSYSDGSSIDVRECESLKGLTVTIGGRLERPIKVALMNENTDAQRDRWRSECEQAINEHAQIKAGRAIVKAKANRFAYDVSILLDITVDDVKTLQECSAQHYDGVCRAAGAVGGFLYGWRNRFDFALDGLEPTEIYATAREIGTCSKILEPTPHYSLYCRLRAAANALSLECCRANGLIEINPAGL